MCDEKPASVFSRLALCMRGKARVSVYGKTGEEAEELIIKEYNDQQEGNLQCNKTC